MRKNERNDEISTRNEVESESNRNVETTKNSRFPNVDATKSDKIDEGSTKKNKKLTGAVKQYPNCKRKRERMKRELLSALSKNFGIVSSACETVGASRSTFYRWLEEDEEFREQFEQIGERALDFVETKMFQGINAGDVRLIQFYLTTKGRRRGYAPKSETEDVGKISFIISEEEASY